MNYFGPRALLMLLTSSLTATAQTAPLFPNDQWKSKPPFTFTYDSKDSATLLSTWEKTDATSSSPGGQTEHLTFTDPETNLKVTADVRTFTDYPAVEWVLKFTNAGKGDTPQSFPLLQSASSQHRSDRQLLG